MKVKLCGLTRPQDMEAANRCRPDYVGFVFAESRRRVTPEQAAALRAGLDPEIRAVGVFVDASVAEMTACAGVAGLDVIQLHGSEPEEVIPELKDALPGIEVWRAVRLKDAGALAAASQSAAHLLLMDAFTADAPGGSGRVADWPLLLEHRPARPFFLAGGLDAGNLKEAMRLVRPHGLDLSSGIETDGRKDPLKMDTVCRMVRELSARYGL